LSVPLCHLQAPRITAILTWKCKKRKLDPFSFDMRPMLFRSSMLDPPSVFDHMILEENKGVAPGPPSVGAARLTPAIGGGAIWALLYRFIEFTSSCPARTVRAIYMTEILLAWEVVRGIEDRTGRHVDVCQPDVPRPESPTCARFHGQG
jgi:hypothetical protein